MLCKYEFGDNLLVAEVCLEQEKLVSSADIDSSRECHLEYYGGKIFKILSIHCGIVISPLAHSSMSHQKVSRRDEASVAIVPGHPSDIKVAHRRLSCMQTMAINPTKVAWHLPRPKILHRALNPNKIRQLAIVIAQR